MNWAGDREPLLQVLEIIERRRSHPLVVDDEGESTYSYGDVFAMAATLASVLAAHGVRQGDRVAVVMNNSPVFVAMYFACLLSGIVIVPVSPTLARTEIAFIISHAGVRLVAVGEATTVSIETSLPVWRVPASLDVRDVTGAPLEASKWPRRSHDEVLSITFTSGTTRLPKGVPQTIGSLMGAASAFNAAVGFAASTRMLHALPMAYMAGFLNTLLGPFVAEGAVVLVRPFDNVSLLSFWEPVVRHEVNAIWMTPTMAAALLRFDRGGAGIEYLRAHRVTISCGTAPLPKTVQDEFERRYGTRLLQSYGLSELLFVSTQRPASPPGRSSVGPLLSGVNIQIRDSDGRAIVAGDGEIFVQTPYLMVGYLDYDTGEPDVLERSAWFATGDIGHVDSGGDCVVTGRKKDLIIRAGTNISPRAVEDVLLRHPALADAAVLGMPDPIYGERVIAAVVMNDGYRFDTERAALFAHCRQELSPLAQPSEIVPFDRFPASITGKVQKHVIREQLLARAGS